MKLQIISDNFVYSLLVDNSDIIALFKNEKIIKNIRHIDIHYHHIQNLIVYELISILYILSVNMTVNELIKTLSEQLFCQFHQMLELIELSELSEKKTSTL